MLLQNLTTIEPDQQMIEVAIKALETVLDKDAIHPETKKVVAFPASDPSA